MRKLVIAVASLGLLALATGTPSESQAAPGNQIRQRQMAFNNKMVSGDQAFQNVTKLMTEIPWYTSLDYAKRKAQAQDKPIFWVHALGQLNGIT